VHDQPLDDEDRALHYITERAARFKTRVIVPSVVVGTLGGFACAALVGLGRGKAAILLSFTGPFVAALFACVLVLRTLLPRLVARWLIEAADRFRVRRSSLIGLVRNTVLFVPDVEAPK
jgi:hypothetical protein